MIPTPGPFAKPITQHVWDDDTETFPTSKSVTPVADYPGESTEVDNPGGDVVTEDRVLLFSPGTSVGDYDEFTRGNGKRYRVNGTAEDYLNPMTGTGILRVSLRRIT